MEKIQLEQLVEELQKIDVKKQCTSKTYLDIIRKGNREVYVTEILAFLLNPLSNETKNNCCARYFINMLGCDIDITDEVHITTNKYAWGDFIDLFIYVPNKLAIVVENKIWSGENGNGQQTQKYYEYCEHCYKHVTCKYVLLKPNGNFIDAYCNRHNDRAIYQTVYYEQLVSDVLKPVSQNASLDIGYKRILTDFIEHCERRFTVSTQIFDYETKIYLKYFNVIKSLQNEYELKMRSIKDLICYHFTADNKYKVDRADDDNTYRFYQGNWYRRYCFYLYFEILFDEGNINNTKCQITLKRYDARGHENEKLDFRKIIDALDSREYKYQVVSSNWYVYYQSSISCDEECTVESFAGKAIAVLENYAAITQSMWETIKTIG